MSQNNYGPKEYWILYILGLAYIMYLFFTGQ